jgi:signal transduction histidine kinase/DNA-binding response OmpR family regulator
MDQTTMSYAQLHAAYQALQEHVIALAGAVAVQPPLAVERHEAPSTAPTPASVIIPDACLAGGGEMGERMRAFDWSTTAVGPVAGWPQSLKTAVSICIGSRYPIVIWWGNPAYTMFYNDAYISFLGVTKHPGWLGRSGRECWHEIWPTIGPMLEGVFATGAATWSEDLLLVLHRNLPREEGYFTFSYSPIQDDAGHVGGIFCACYETTGRVIGERRLQTLRNLGRTVMDVQSAEEACAVAAQTLTANAADIPFALIYLLDADAHYAHLAATTGMEAGSGAAPAQIALHASAESAMWPLRRVVDTAAATLVTDLAARCGPLPGGPWPESPDAALLLPIANPGQTRLPGVLVVGLSPRRVVDADYRSFCELIAGHVGTAIANTRAYEAERQRAEALAELDRAKTAFFSNVSHEFRTPLTLMLGPVEDLLAAPAAQVGPEPRELLTIVHRNGLRLQRLVNTLLDFSRIEAGRIQAVYEPTDLAAVTADLASTFRSACERAGLRLVVDCLALPEPVYVDRDMWEKVVLNLLSNAFKFTFAGEIVVTLHPARAAVELAVRDTGIGIPATELPHLFERFYRVEGARGRTHEGTGIGLALVQDLVRLHGGSVQVESAPGQGSTFCVSLPTGMAHLPAGRIGGSRTLASTALGASPYVEEALRWVPEAPPLPHTPRDAATTHEVVPAHLLTAPPLPTLPHTAWASSRRARILWADDNADMRDYVRRLLSTRYEVEAVADGEMALAAARARRPDLVLADVMMPRLDGFGVLRALRADPELRTLPVILLSARAGEEARIEGLAAGADAYLIKPFSARELLAYVEAHLELGRLRVHVEQMVRESAAHIAELNAQLQADLTSMTRLQQVSTRLVQTRDISALLDEILDAAIEITGADMGNIQLLDGDALKIVAHRGFAPPFLAFFNTVHEGLAACGMALHAASA